MSRLPALLRRLPAADPRPDGQLLAAFLTRHDEAAFAELVRRHGSVVWGVCRRHLPDPADAEDAFQAAFLVLVRRAGRLTGAPSVGPWLYRVAAWTARNLRRKNARRLARRRDVPAELPHPPADADLALDLDAALLALPEKYRTPLVLCHLEGWSRRDAAAHLGCPEGTLSALLARGLAKLRRALAGRDPAPLLAAAAVSVPIPLSAATARAAVAFHTASAAATPAVFQLAEGVIRMMWVKQATAAGLAAVMLVTAGIGVGLGVRQAPTAGAADEKPAAGKPGPTAGQSKPDKPQAGPVADAELANLRAVLERYRGSLALVQAEVVVADQAKQDAEERVRSIEEQIRRVGEQCERLERAKRTGSGSATVQPPAKTTPGRADGTPPEDQLAAKLRRLQAEAKRHALRQQQLAAESEQTTLSLAEIRAEIARLEEERRTKPQPVELVVGSTTASYPYSFIEREPSGDVELSVSASGETGLRRYLRLIRTGPSAPESLVISVARGAPTARLGPAILAAKAAGFKAAILKGDVPTGLSFGRGRFVSDPRSPGDIQLDLSDIDEVRIP